MPVPSSLIEVVLLAAEEVDNVDSVDAPLVPVPAVDRPPMRLVVNEPVLLLRIVEVDFEE